MADNLARIRETIGSQPVKIIAVTKGVGPDGIAEAFRCGVTEFGENRVQDALAKQRQLTASIAEKVNWHFIGHLQTNKVKHVVGKFVLVHSVDSLHLARQISDHAAKSGITQAVLLQVKILPDPGKFGFTVDKLRQDFPQVLALPGIKVEGLMTICPLSEDPETWRTCFLGLKALSAELKSRYGVELPELSMGMTQDWAEAVRCGATMVRLGRAIFAH